MKKQKLNLDSLTVKSLVIEMEEKQSETLKGGTIGKTFFLCTVKLCIPPITTTKPFPKIGDADDVSNGL